MEVLMCGRPGLAGGGMLGALVATLCFRLSQPEHLKTGTPQTHSCSLLPAGGMSLSLKQPMRTGAAQRWEAVGDTEESMGMFSSSIR